MPATSAARSRCEFIVNCAGQWAREFGALAGVDVPLLIGRALLHRHGTDDGRDHPMMPVIRDPDGYIYFKEEVGGIVMGGFEPKAKPWDVDANSRPTSSSSCWPRTGTSSKC